MVAVCHFGNGVEVCHVRVRITESLGEDQFGFGTDGSVQCFEVTERNDGVADALCGERVGDEIIGASVEIVCADDVVAGCENVLKRIGDGSCTACHGESCNASFECGNAAFKDSLRGVGQTAVDVARVAQTETVGGVGGVTEDVGSGLIDGHGACIGGGVRLFLSYVELERLEVKFFLSHGV